MKVALATWNGRISPVFDVARQLVLVDVVGGCVTNRREERLPGTEPHAQAAALVGCAPDVLICGAVSRPLAGLLESAGVRTMPFTAGAVEDVLSAWLDGKLPSPSLSMPGCCRRRFGCRGGGRRGGQGGGRFGMSGRGPRENVE